MKLRFAESIPLPIGFLVAAIAVALVVVAWRTLRPAADARFRRILLGLRIAAVLFLTALLLSPTLSHDRLRSENLSVVLLVDRSRSMSIADSWEGRPRHRVASEFLRRPGTGLYPQLKDDFRIVPLAFDASVRAAANADLAGEAQPSGNLTDLAQALRGAAKASPRAETAAIVLLSDGADNGGGDLRNAAAEAGVPVYAVGFGSRAGTGTKRRDLALLSVEAPETAFAGNTVVVEVAVRSTGYDLSDPGNRRVRVVLEEGTREIGSEPLELAEDAPVRVSLRFVPEGTGQKTYRVRVPLRGDEAIPGNNERTFPVTVRERSAAVLYFDATMRWEAKFLRDFLARDPAFDLTSVLHPGQGRLLVNGDAHGVDLSQGLPKTAEGFSRFDVLILGDVAADSVPKESLELLRAWVEKGGGLLTLGGYHAYGAGGYAGTPLAEALPVFIAASDGQIEEPLSLTVTPEGRVHPVLSGLESWFLARVRPGLEGMTAVRNEKPGAQVLLTAEGKDGGKKGIVLAAELYGEGRSIAFTGDTSFVWFRSAELGGPEGLYRRFWGQVMRWLLEEKPEVSQTGDPVVVFPDRPEYRIGETVRVRVRVRGADGALVSDADVKLAVAGAAGETKLAPRPLASVPGHYEDLWRALASGDYELRAEAAKGGTPLGKGAAKFRVTANSIEMDVVDLGEEALTAIARASGGSFYVGAPTAEQVAADIRGSLVGLVEHEELSLSNTPAFFLIFTALLTAEWLLRRRRNLL